MKAIDLNADIGEADSPDWAQAETEILSYISSANIACGGHAGNPDTMRKTVQAAKARGIIIGAHPSYPDRENFGRASKRLGIDIDASELKTSLREQILALRNIAKEEGTDIAYVKPHGALYNDSVIHADTATLIAEVIKDIDPGLTFMGAPHSEMGIAAEQAGLTFIAEGFIDRRYTDDGHLQSRTIEGAVIKDQPTRIAQALSLAMQQKVTTATGRTLDIPARTLCLHGDSAGAVESARLARDAIEKQGIFIKAFIHA